MPKRTRPRLLSATDLATYLGISRSSLYAMIDAGLPGYRFGSGVGRSYYDPEQVLSWAAERDRRVRTTGDIQAR